jgi:hypothetical protein
MSGLQGTAVRWKTIEWRVAREVRAMTRREVIVKAINGQITWIQVALIITDRQMRRLKRRYEREGYDGIVDQRDSRPRPRKIPTRADRAQRQRRNPAGLELQLSPTCLRPTLARCPVTVHELLDETLAVSFQGRAVARFAPRQPLHPIYPRQFIPVRPDSRSWSWPWLHTKWEKFPL